MKKIHIYLFIFLISIIFINCSEKSYNHSNNEDNLYFVFSTFRHGARKPFVQQDIFKNEVEHIGRLTKYGEIQHLNIGKKNRDRYFNFLNLGDKIFDTNQILVRCSASQRVLTSTQKQLEGLFNSEKYSKIIHSIKLVETAFELYNFNIFKDIDIMSYYNDCKNFRKLNQFKKREEYDNDFYENILPSFEKCYGKTQFKSIFSFCDQFFSSYFEYTYESTKENKITKCENKTINKINNFCVKYFDSYIGWDEELAYYFYGFFTKLFKFMQDAINEVSKFKMFMIGGHDSSVAPLMNFLNGLNIVKRTEYPHYAFNIIFELRKYNSKYYIEIYYNDILKYNKTMKEFKNVLDKSKYRNKNNFCKTIYLNKVKKYENENKNSFRNKVIIILVLLLANGIIFFILIKEKKVDKNLTNNFEDSSKIDIKHEIK